MKPKGIIVLLGERRAFGDTIKRLTACCEKNDPRGHGCGYEGLCRSLFNKRDDDWEWQRRFQYIKWSPSPSRVSDWLMHSIPGARTSRKEGHL